MIVAIRNGNVLDTGTMTIVGERTVVLDGDRIADVLDSAAHVESDLDIDAAGGFVLPGFIDAHVHHTIVTMDFRRLANMTPVERGIHMARLAAANVHRGFTTVRDAAGELHGLLAAIGSGATLGPRIVTAGRALSQTGGHADLRPGSVEVSCACSLHADSMAYVVDGVDAVRKAARLALREGSQFIKIMASGGVASPTDPFDSVQFTAEEIAAITTESDHRHTYTTAHAYLPDAIDVAITNGVRCIEHGNGIDAAIARKMAELDVTMVPTLVTYRALQEDGPKLGLPQVSIDKNSGVFDMGLASIEVARTAGVELGFGTDLLGEAQVRQNQEFEIRADLEPAADVLRSMYVTNAKLCRLEGQIGTITPGAFADLVVSDVNPLEQLGALARPDAHLTHIVQNGVPIAR